MSIFGTQTTTAAAPGPASFSFGSNLLAPKTTASTTSSGFSLGTFSFTTPTTTTTTTAPSVFAAPPAPTTAQQPTATTGPGLGGSTLSGLNVSTTTAAGVQKPKDTAVPQELMTLVEALRKQIKTNKDISDELAAVSVNNVQEFTEQLQHSRRHLGVVASRMGKIVQKADFLKDQSRQDLRQTELVQRRNESIPAQQFAYGVGASNFDLQPIGYLHSLVETYEQQLMNYQEELRQIERSIERRLCSHEQGTDHHADSSTVSPEDVVIHIKRMEETIKLLASKVYEVHDLIESAKVGFMRYRRSLHGENASNPFDAKAPPGGLPKKLEGPDPFSSDQHFSSLIGMATAMSNTAVGVGGLLPPRTSLFQPASQTQGSSLFGGGAASGFGSGFGQSTGQGSGLGLFGATPSGPAPGQTGTASLFRPFGTSTTGTPSLGTAFGSVSSTTSTAASTPFKFSSPFSNASSGTLFGGSATSVGTVKPFGTR